MLTKPLAGVMDNPLHPLSQGCVCHFLFNEGAGSLAYDVGGHGNHGILNNMSPNAQDSGWEGSKFGGGLDFDGINNYVEVAGLANINWIGGFSVEAWIKPDTISDDHAIVESYLWEPGYGGFRLRQQGTSVWIYLVWDQSSVSSHATAVLSENTWCHIVGIWNGTYTGLYLNGVLKDSDNYSPTNLLSSNSVYISKRGDGGAEYFNGAIDNVCIYNRALNAEEIKQLYINPFCNVIQVPPWQLYSPVAGLRIPVAMHHYKMLRAR